MKKNEKITQKAPKLLERKSYVILKDGTVMTMDEYRTLKSSSNT